MNPEERAEKFQFAWTDVDPATTRSVRLPDMPATRLLLAGTIREAEQEAARRTLDQCIQVIAGGHFLHDDAPAARFAREVIAALRREVKL